MSADKTRTDRFAWIVCAVLVLIVLAALLDDRRLKSSNALGFVPNHAEWILRANDAPAVFEAVHQSQDYRAARAAVALPRENWPLVIRRATGIRPTPQRWRLWMGNGIVASTTSDGPGICVRPGFLMNIYGRLTGHMDAGIQSRGGVFFAWRDGFLILSKSRLYVKASLYDSAKLIQKRSDENVLTIKKGTFEVDIEAAPTLPIRVRYQHTFTPATTPLTLHNAWPHDPILHITGVNPAELLELARKKIPDSPMTDYLDETLAALQEELPPALATEGDEFSLALLGADTSEELPIPEMALLQSGNAAGILPDRPAEALPFEWNRSSGWIRPWLGPELSICVAANDRTRYIANQERLMPSLVGHLRDAPAIEADAAITVHWRRAAPLATQLILQAANLELIPRHNAEDIERGFVPYLELLAKLGQCHLTAQTQNDIIEFNGHLIQPAE